jgi:hypothetical protein
VPCFSRGRPLYAAGCAGFLRNNGLLSKEEDVRIGAQKGGERLGFAVEQIVATYFR